MAKTIKQRADELAEAFVRLDLAADRWIAGKSKHDYDRVASARELSDRSVEWYQAVHRTTREGAK